MKKITICIIALLAVCAASIKARQNNHVSEHAINGRISVNGQKRLLSEKGLPAIDRRDTINMEVATSEMDGKVDTVYAIYVVVTDADTITTRIDKAKDGYTTKMDTIPIRAKKAADYQQKIEDKNRVHKEQNISAPLGAVPSSPNEKDALMYEISGNGLKQPSYILGSMHLIDGEFAHQIRGFDRIFKEVKQVAFERNDTLDEQIKDSIKQWQNSLPYNEKNVSVSPVMPKDSCYSDFLNPQQLCFMDAVLKLLPQRAGDYLSELLDSCGVSPNPKDSLFLFSRLEPSLIMGCVNRAMVFFLKKNSVDLDYGILHLANENHLRTISLDDIDVFKRSYMFDIARAGQLHKMSMEKRVKCLYDYCKLYPDWEKTKQKYTSLYMAQKGHEAILTNSYNGERAALKFNKTYGLYNEDHNRLVLKQRNEKWMQKIPNIIGQEPTLIVVGGGHLYESHEPECQGLLRDLQDLGYTIRPVTQ